MTIHPYSALILLPLLFISSQAQAQERAFAASEEEADHRRYERQSHIASLVEWFEEQQAYLKYLENLKGAVEKELSIISLMSACQQQGAECTGRGIVLSAAAPDSAQQSPPSAGEEEARRPQAAQPKPSSSQNLPTVLAVYRDSALVEHQGRRLRVRSGDRLADFRVRAISLDQFELESANGVVRLPVYWPLSSLSADSSDPRL